MLCNLGRASPSCGLAVGRALVIRLQGVTSAEEKLANGDGDGFPTQGTVTRAPHGRTG